MENDGWQWIERFSRRREEGGGGGAERSPEVEGNSEQQGPRPGKVFWGFLTSMPGKFISKNPNYC